MSNEKKEYLAVKEEFDIKLSQAVKANGGIELVTPSGDLISMILLVEPKGMIATCEYDNHVDPFKVDRILQCTETGKVFLESYKYGLANIDTFDFIGSKKALRKFIEQERERNILDVANLQVG